MNGLPLLTFAQFVTLMSNMLANTTSAITNLRSGSVALAFIRAVAGVALSLQQLAVHIFNVTRLATSTGNDVDTFINDWGLNRPQATPVFGSMNATRYGIGVPLYLPVASLDANGNIVNPTNIVQSALNKIQFAPVADLNQPNYDPINEWYFFGDQDATISFTAQALVPGTAGRVIAGAVSQIVTGFTGIVSVTNPLPFNNGSDTYTDSQTKALFPVFLDSLATANNSSIELAIEKVPNLTYQILQYLAPNNITPFPAGFSVIVDDGSGNIPQATINRVIANITAVRAAGSQFMVAAPTNEPINIGVSVAVTPGTSLPSIQAAVSAALTTYINGLGVGVNVSYVDVGNVVQNVAGVFSYSSLTLNGNDIDIPIALNQLARSGTVTFS